MREHTRIDSIKDWWYSIEYRFAKRWLDRTFGKQEFWGDIISELLSKDTY